MLVAPVAYGKDLEQTGMSLVCELHATDPYWNGDSYMHNVTY